MTKDTDISASPTIDTIDPIEPTGKRPRGFHLHFTEIDGFWCLEIEGLGCTRMMFHKNLWFLINESPEILELAVIENQTPGIPQPNEDDNSGL